MAVGKGRAARAGRAHTRWLAAPVVALAVLAGCSSTPDGPDVVVVGDAPMVVARSQVGAILHPAYTTTFLVRADGTIAGLSAQLRATLASSGTPKAVVTDVGTTDALRPTAATAGPAPLAPLVAATSGVPCVVLTTVGVQADRRSGGTVAARVNHEIVQLADADPRTYKVVDWNEFIATLPPPSVSTYLAAGGVLETPAGAHWLATADLAAVRACGSPHQPTVVGPNPG